MASIHPIARARRSHLPSVPQAIRALAQALPSRIHFWRGASGQRHRCSVYGLLECPPLPNATYLLVQRTHDGRRRILAIGCVEQDHPPLNLATLRQMSAVLGANEVHIAHVRDDAVSRCALAQDLELASASFPLPAASSLAGSPHA